MINGERWLSESVEQTAIDQKLKSSSLRTKRSVQWLDSSSSESENMDNNEENISMTMLFAELKKINSTLLTMNESINEVKGEIHTLKVENDNRKKEIDELRSENEFLHTKLRELETRVSIALERSSHNAQYSRRNNIRIYGVKEAKGENVIATVTNLINTKLGLKDFKSYEIDVAHRLGVYDNSPIDPKPRAIIVRFVRRIVRDIVIKNRRKLAGTRMSIQDDLTKQNLQLLKQVKQHPIVNSAWAQDGRIMICVKESGKVTQVQSMAHLEENRIEWRNWVNPRPKESPAADDASKEGQAEIHQPQQNQQNQNGNTNNGNQEGDTDDNMES